MNPKAWYLLVHRVPATPLYMRARIRTLLARLGAVALKKSVYALPKDPGALGRLQGVAEEIRRCGGEAYVCEARFPDAKDHAALMESFRHQRVAEYAALAASARRLAAPGARAEDPAHRRRAAKLRREFERLASVDFFGASGRAEAESALRGLERRLVSSGSPRARSSSPWTGRTWVTRRGVHVDRIVCAWYIRRFLDSRARFRFVASGPGGLRPGELGFDMPGVEFTHEEDRCSLETLIAKTGRADRALSRIAGIVHDLDLKDHKFGYPETPGIERLLGGILATHADDAERIERGGALFDDLYRSLDPRPVISAPKGVSGLVPRRPRSRRGS